MLREPAELGITHIDTADAYGPRVTDQLNRGRFTRTPQVCASRRRPSSTVTGRMA
ncbi:hypothetical protein GCM10025331_83310 [Actinoplanes utahensis]|nr:hypothetical protein Aut01nite_84770 [Actinoplanes utahensis]